MAAGFVIVSACGGGAPAPRTPDQLQHLRLAATVGSYHPTSAVAIVTSLAQVDAATVLICDGAHVYRVARGPSGYSVTRLADPAAPGWSPTGVAYAGGELYVASSQAHEIAKLRVVNDGLVPAGRIGGDLASPANLAVEADGSVLVADFGGGALVKYGPEGGQRWSRPIDRPHGVTWIGGRIYVSSLVDASITELDEAGAVLTSTTSMGAAGDRYLSPGGLAGDGSRVVVTDTRAGRITVLDGDLHLVSSAGGNGPGLDAFNYPSATLPVADGYVVADSYRQRLVHLDRRWVVHDQIAFGPRVPVGHDEPLVSATGALPSAYAMLPGVDIPHEMGLRRVALRFTGGYGGLIHVDSNGSLNQLSLSDPRAGGAYVLWAQKVGSLVVVGSPQRTQLEVIDPATGMFTYVQVGWDTWWKDGTLLLPDDRRQSLTDAVKPATTGFAAARALLSRGVPRREAFDQALTNGRPLMWTDDLASPAARQFLQSAMSADDASRYDRAALQQIVVPVNELLEVRYLSG